MRLLTQLATPIILLTALISGCSGENKPSAAQLRAALAEQLPDQFAVSSFDLESMENTGNNVEPNYIARFKATVEVSTPLYELNGRDGNIVFVKELTESGHEQDIYGRSASELYQGGWRHQLLLDGDPLSPLGRTVESFAPRQALVRGSAEEIAHFAALEAANAEFNATIASLPVHEMIADFYATKGPFAGTYQIHEVSASRNEKHANDSFTAHARYSYRKVNETTPAGEDARAFRFSKVDDEWRVTSIGGARSARL